VLPLRHCVRPPAGFIGCLQTTEQKVRIKTRDYVKKIAVYK
jgi:hypothetical protein